MGRMQRLFGVMALWAVGLAVVVALTGLPCAGSLWVGAKEPAPVPGSAYHLRPARPAPSAEGELAQVLALSFAVSGSALGTAWSATLGLAAVMLVVRRSPLPEQPVRPSNPTMYQALLD